MSLYERCGIKEYWIVDIDNTSIEVYLLKEGSFVIDEVYRIFPEHVREEMTEEELNEIKSEFSVSLFPQLTINLHEVFERII